MYNGIGLTTPRGSGTNGYVQRNLANVYKPKDKNSFKAPTEISAPSLRKPNTDIIEHDRKRKIELKCLEFQQMLEDQKYSEEEIDKRVTTYRQSLIEDHSAVQKDEHGRIIVKETHEIAEAQLRKNQKLREAFGISEYFVEGSSFDPERHAKEAAAKTAIEETKKYALIPSPPTSDDEPPSVETAAIDASPKAKKRSRKSPSPAADVKKKKKKKHKRNASSQPESKKSGTKNKSGKISEKRSNKSRISRSLSSEKSNASVERNVKSHHQNKKSKHVDNSSKYEKRRKHSSLSPVKSGKHKKGRLPSPETRREKKKAHVPELVDEREMSKHRHRHRGDHNDDHDKRQRKEPDLRTRCSNRESSSVERTRHEERPEERTAGRKCGRNAVSSNERATTIGRRDTVDEKARRRRRDVESSADERKRRHRRDTGSSTERDQRGVDEHSDGERRKRRGKESADRHVARPTSGHKRRRSPSSESSSAERGPRRKVRSSSKSAAMPPHRTKRSRRSETPPPLLDKRYYAEVEPTNSRRTRKQSSDSDGASEPVAVKSKLKSKVVQKVRGTNARADDRHENRDARTREQRHVVASTDSEADSEADVESYKSLRPKYAPKKRDKHDDLLEEAERNRTKHGVPMAGTAKSKFSADEQRRRRDESVAATFPSDERGKSKGDRNRKDGCGNVADVPRRTNEQTEQQPDSKESKKSTQRRGEPKAVENGVSDAAQSAKRDGSASSSLSYSPMEKFPHRYLDILSDMPRKSNRQPTATATIANQRSQKLDDQSAVVSKANDRLRRDAETTNAVESERNKKKEADMPRKADTVTAVVAAAAATLPVNVIDVPLPADTPARLAVAVSKDERADDAGDTTKTSTNNRVHEVVSSALKADPTKTYASLMKLMSTTLRKRRPSSSSSDSSRKEKSRSNNSSSSSSDSSQSSAKSQDSSSSSTSSSDSSSSDESTPRKDRKRRSRSTSAEGHKSRHSSSYSSSDSSRSRSRSRSESKDRKKKKKAHRRRSRSASDSHSDSSSSSNSRSRSISIPRRRGSPSFLERRRITSARKRPVPYQRLSVLRSPSQGSVSSSSSSSSGVASSSSSSPVSRHSRLSSPTSRYSKLSSSLPRRRSSSFRTPSPIAGSPIPWVTPLTESYDRFNRS